VTIAGEGTYLQYALDICTFGKQKSGPPPAEDGPSRTLLSEGLVEGNTKARDITCLAWEGDGEVMVSM